MNAISFSSSVKKSNVNDYKNLRAISQILAKCGEGDGAAAVGDGADLMDFEPNRAGAVEGGSIAGCFGQVDYS